MVNQGNMQNYMRKMKSFLFLLSLMVHINVQTAQPFFPDLGPPGFGPPPLHDPRRNFNGLPMLRRRPSRGDSSRFDSRDRHRSRDHMMDPYDHLDGRGRPRRRSRDPINPLDRREQRLRVRDSFEPMDRQRSRTRMTDRHDPIERGSSRRRGRDPINPVDRRGSNSRLSDPYEPSPLDRPSSRHSSPERRDPHDSRTSSRHYDPSDRQLTGSPRTSDVHNGVRRNEHIRDGTGSEGRRHFVENSRPRPNQSMSTGHSNIIESRSFQNRGQNPSPNDLQNRGQNYPIQSNQMTQGQHESDMRNTHSVRPANDLSVYDPNMPAGHQDRGPLIPNRTQQQQSQMQRDQDHTSYNNPVPVPGNPHRPMSNNNRQSEKMPIGQIAKQQTHTGIKHTAIDKAIVDSNFGTTPSYEIIYLNINDSSHGPNMAELAQSGHPPELLAALERVLRHPSKSQGVHEATTLSKTKNPGVLKQQTLQDFNTLSASDRQGLLALLHSNGGLSAGKQSIQTIQPKVGNSAKTQPLSTMHSIGLDQTSNAFSASDRQTLLALLQPNGGRDAGTQPFQTIQSNVGNSGTSQSLATMHSSGLGQTSNTLSASQRQMLLALLQPNGGRSAGTQPLPTMQSSGLGQLFNQLSASNSQHMPASLPSTGGHGIGTQSLPNMQSNGFDQMLNAAMNQNVGGHGFGSIGNPQSGGQGMFGNNLSMRDFFMLEGLS